MSLWNRLLADSYPIFVRNLQGKSLMIAVHSNVTISMLKRLLYKREGVPVKMQRLSYEGKDLLDELTLKELNVRRDATLFLKHHQG